MAKPIDPKLLAGLTFRSSQGKKVKGENGDTTTFIPTERDLTTDDVLDWKDNGATVTIVTADGQKYTINKKPAKGGDGQGDQQ